MSDQPTEPTGPVDPMDPASPAADPALRREAGLDALDRAHRAARDLNGGELRRALQEAHEALAGAGVSSTAAKVAEALADLDDGPLDRAELLIEQARTELAPSRGA